MGFWDNFRVRGIQEMTSYQRQLKDEQTDEGWTSISKAAGKRDRTWSDVKDNLKESFIAWSTNPMAKSYCDYMRYFVIGKGTQISVPEEEGDDARDRLELFLELNEWELLEKQVTEELSRDGEVFVRLHGSNQFGMEAEVKALSLIDPLEVTAIDCPEVGRPRRYRRDYSKLGNMSDDGIQDREAITEWIDAEEIVHVKINTSYNELRGRSDLLVVLPWLQQLKRWLSDMSRRNYMINAFNWDVEVSGGIKPSTISERYKNKPPMPGSVIIHGPNEKWSVLSPDMKWNDSTTGARAIKLLACAGFKMPESWFGDTGESNLATTKALAMPTLRTFMDRQDTLRYYFAEIVKRGAGVENVDIQFPEIVSEEASEKANAMKALSEALMNLTSMGLVSRETAYGIAQMYVDGLDDWEDDSSGAGEKKKIEDEEAEEATATAVGKRTPEPAGLVRPALEEPGGPGGEEAPGFPAPGT